MRYLFLKRLMVFLLTFLATCGIVSVDRACAELSAREEIIGITMQRGGENEIQLRYFGQENLVDVEPVLRQWEEIKKNWRDVTESRSSETDKILCMTSGQTK